MAFIRFTNHCIVFVYIFYSIFFFIGVIALEKLSGHLCPSASYLSLQKIIFNNHYFIS